MTKCVQLNIIIPENPSLRRKLNAANYLSNGNKYNNDELIYYSEKNKQ